MRVQNYNIYLNYISIPMQNLKLVPGWVPRPSRGCLSGSRRGQGVFPRKYRSIQMFMSLFLLVLFTNKTCKKLI